jgi:ankyrin repeat protein
MAAFRSSKNGFVITVKMTANSGADRLTAADVLRRYNDEDFPSFCGMQLESVNQVGNFGERPLHVAAARANMEEIVALVEAGADVNAPGDLANTALHEVVGQGQTEAIKFLLESGASISAENEFGQTPLDIARLKGRDDVVKLLQEGPGQANPRQ